MKKLFIIVLCSVLLLSAVSCKPSGGDTSGRGGTFIEEEYDDKYIYLNRKWGDVITYCKINTETGATTPVCPDPLCSHDGVECVFYGMGGSPQFCGKYIFYLSGQSDSLFGGNTSVSRFDLESGKCKIIFECGEGVMEPNINAEGQYVQFGTSLYEDGETKYGLYLYDRASEKVRLMNEEVLYEMPSLSAVKDGRLYWRQDSGYFSTDLDFKDRIEGDMLYAHGNVELVLSNTGEYRDYMPVQKLCVYDDVTGELKVIFEETPALPFKYRDKVFFFKFSDEEILLGEEWGEDNSGNTVKKPVYLKHGGKLYVCDRDGSNQREILDIRGTGLNFGVACGIDGKGGAGDWVGVTLYSYDEQPDGTIKRGDNRIMLVNIVTGESRLVEDADS